jgi:hypothetical protein
MEVSGQPYAPAAAPPRIRSPDLKYCVIVCGVGSTDLEWIGGLKI